MVKQLLNLILQRNFLAQVGAPFWGLAYYSFGQHWAVFILTHKYVVFLQ